MEESINDIPSFDPQYTTLVTQVQMDKIELDELKARKVELQKKIELISETEVNMQSIKEYCELARHNLGNLSFSEKRNALESLRVRVIAGKGDLRLEGTLPIVSSQCA